MDIIREDFTNYKQQRIFPLSDCRPRKRFSCFKWMYVYFFYLNLHLYENANVLGFQETTFPLIWVKTRSKRMLKTQFSRWFFTPPRATCPMFRDVTCLPTPKHPQPTENDDVRKINKNQTRRAEPSAEGACTFHHQAKTSLSSLFRL